ncbi:Ferrichrome-iron receptor [Nitrospira sp. KM1]|uniref:TonB-dependent siderophore receptor n=1 Tax=Nitrospira sp. KM1 TaxID=1936990 RepID=UPI0013A7ABC2|nr:TonB-dependent receptor [Nitrospira sp. KM1]BCA56596.1 Ferrichrome-iron receptor [Nitrospira sp. KM1]
MRPFGVSVSLIVRIGVFCLLALGWGFYDVRPAAAAEENQSSSSRQFDIDAQPLGSAVAAFAAATRYQVLYGEGIHQDTPTKGVKGTFTPEDALKHLLEGTGVTYRFTDDTTFTLERDSSSGLPGLVGAGAAGVAAGSMAAADGSEEAAQSVQKPVKVPEITVKDVKQRDDDAKSYVAEDASTATRTNTPLIDVPSSVEIVTRKVMDDQRAVRLEQALRNVSGVVTNEIVGRGINNDVTVCRGFACGYFKNNLRNDNGQQVLTYRDVANIQRLEVLKGPPSVLYGRSEPSGIVNIMTKQPQEEKYASLEAIFGSYGLYRPMVDITGPLNEEKTLLYRVNAAYENSESFRDIVRGQRYFVAPVFTWKMDNKTTLTIEGEYIKNYATFDPGLPALGSGAPAVPNSRYLGEPFAHQDTEEGRAGFVLTHHLNSSWRIESLMRADVTHRRTLAVFTNGVLPGNQLVSRSAQDTISDAHSYYWRNDVIGNVATGSVKHTVLGGVELGRQDRSSALGGILINPLNMFNPVYGQNPPLNIPITNRSDAFANAAGVYLQDQAALLDNLHLLIGARGDYFYQHSSAGIAARTETKAENWAFSPRIGMTFQPVKPVAIYANVTRSFNPQFNVLGNADNQFNPETGTQYEAGVKTDVVPGRLTSTLAFYRIVKRNVVTVDPFNPLLSVQTGEQRSQGIEFDVAAQLLPGWKVIATYAYTDARITSDNFFPVGNRLPLVARHTGSLWSTYDFQAGLLENFGVGGGLFAVGERAGDLNNTFEIPGYVRADAALYYRKPDIFTHTNLIAQLNVQNAFDQPYYTGGAGNRSAGFFPGAPLSFIGSVKLEFY